MEFWIGWFHEKTDGEDVKTIARTAEEVGFAGVALSDHIALPKHQLARHPETGIAYDTRVPNVDPFTVAATMGAVTTQLRFMTYALVAGMRDPFSITRQSASLAGLTDNRFSLGITPGWLTDEIALLGYDPKTRGKRFDEALQVISGLWQNDLFSFAGEHYNFADVAVCPRPATPPLLFIGGNSPRSFRRAKSYDGWIGMTMTIDAVAAVADTVRSEDANKKIYIIPAERLSHKYLQGLESVGVTGLINMIWMPGDPKAAATEQKCERLRAFASKWIQ